MPPPTAAPSPANADPSHGPSVRERVGRIIDLIRPAVQADGGDVEFVEMTPGGVVRIRLHGACVGCPSSSITLKSGIERNLRDYVPEVTGLEAVD